MRCPFSPLKSVVLKTCKKELPFCYFSLVLTKKGQIILIHSHMILFSRAGPLNTQWCSSETPGARSSSSRRIKCCLLPRRSIAIWWNLSPAYLWTSRLITKRPQGCGKYLHPAVPKNSSAKISSNKNRNSVRHPTGIHLGGGQRTWSFPLGTPMPEPPSVAHRDSRSLQAAEITTKGWSILSLWQLFFGKKVEPLNYEEKSGSFTSCNSSTRELHAWHCPERTTEIIPAHFSG